MIGIGLGVVQSSNVLTTQGGVSAPIALTATGIGETSFTANWQSYSGAVVYLLDVSTSPTFDTFILQDEEINAPTTSYVVIGLNPNTTYYYRVRASTEALTDPDAQAFFDRVTTAGGSLSTTEQDAVNTLVLQMKSDGIWSKMKAIYPMVGGGSGTTAARQAACAQNLKSSSFTGTFTATGWTFASTGVTPNGTSAYMDTLFTPSVDNIANSAHISFYSRTNISTSTISMGCYDGTNYNQLAIRFAGTSYFNINNGSGSVVVNYSDGNSLGFYLASRTSATDVFAQKNTTQTTGSAAQNRNANNIYIGKPNGVSGYHDSKECAFASIGDGLTTTEADDFYTAVQAFQTTLSRNV